MSQADHCSALAEQASAFAATVGLVDPAAPVPDCPGWTVRELVVHTAGLYRWATRLVEQRIVVETWRNQMEIDYPADDADAEALSRWVSAALDPMMEAFAADGAVPVWTWGRSNRARFWPRRMLFETLVHGLDLSRSATPHAPVDLAVGPALAEDCLDEMLELLPSRARWAAEADTRPPVLGTIVLAPTDHPARWRIRCRPTGMWWDRGVERADATLTGPVGELIALCHQRGTLDQPVGSTPVEVAGDRALAEDWLDRLGF